MVNTSLYLKKGLLLFAAGSLLLITACKKVETTTPPCVSGSFTASFENKPQEQLKELRGILDKELQGGRMQWKLDLQGTVNDGTIIFSIINWDFQSPPRGGLLTKSYSTSENQSVPELDCRNDGGVDYCDVAKLTFKKNDASTIFMSDAAETTSFIRIVSCDTLKGTVSGNYQVYLVNRFDDDTLFVKGAFTDACFTDLN